MRLREDCKVISLRGHHLLSTGEKTMEVNQSFAEIWKIAASRPFSIESLTDQVMDLYDLDRTDAERETSSLIEIWKTYNLLEDSD